MVHNGFKNCYITIWHILLLKIFRRSKKRGAETFFIGRNRGARTFFVGRNRGARTFFVGRNWGARTFFAGRKEFPPIFKNTYLSQMAPLRRHQHPTSSKTGDGDIFCYF